MGLSVTIASGKGGTGKTTISANLGVALAQMGKNVIIVDADIEMANLELHLGMEGMKTTLHDVLAGEADVKDAIYNGPGGVRAVPAGMSLDGLRKVEYDRLEGVLNELAKMCDFLLIDVPSGIGRSVIVALSADRDILLVATPEISAMSDVLKTKIVAKKIGANILGVVLNRALFDKSDLTVKEVETILETKVVAVIPEDAEIKRSAASGQPAVLRSPDAPAVVAVKRLAASLVGEDIEQLPPPTSESPEKSLIDKLKSGIFRR